MSFPKNALSGARLALAALLCAAFPAQAADETNLRPTLDVEQGYDSNIFNDSDDTEGSLITTISPSLTLENAGELGHARMSVTARARNVWRESDLSGIDALLRGDLNRKLTPRFSVFGDGAYDYYSGYEEISEGGTPGEPGEILTDEQPSWVRDQLGGGFTYLLTERLSYTLRGYGGRINYEAVDAGTSEGYYRDRTLFGGSTMLLYQLTARDQVLLETGVDDTEYQDLGTGTNDTSIWSSEIGWNRTWTQAWTSTAKIGFSVTDTTLNNAPQIGSRFGLCVVGGVLSVTCPVGLPARDFSTSGSALIGSLSLKRVFARGFMELAYNRDTQSTGGSGRTNFDIDSFTLSWTQRLAERVRLTLTGNYSIYESVSDDLPSYPARFASGGTGTPLCVNGGAPVVVALIDQEPTDIPVWQCFGGSSSETRNYATFVGRLDWQLRRQLSTYLIASYRTSQTDQERGNFGSIQTEDLDKFTLGAGFRWYHDLGL